MLTQQGQSTDSFNMVRLQIKVETKCSSVRRDKEKAWKVSENGNHLILKNPFNTLKCLVRLVFFCSLIKISEYHTQKEK